jgi:hypothetical protein
VIEHSLNVAPSPSAVIATFSVSIMMAAVEGWRPRRVVMATNSRSIHKASRIVWLRFSVGGNTNEAGLFYSSSGADVVRVRDYAKGVCQR